MKNSIYLAVFLVSCKAATIPVDDSLAEVAVPYEVSGKNGWQLNQSIRFGPYRTEPIDKSMVFSWQIPFLVDLSGSRESLSFQLFDTDDQKAVNVFGTSQLNELHRFGLTLTQKDVFSGSLVFAQPEVHYYDFILLNPNDQNQKMRSKGAIKKNEADWIEIRGISKLEGSKVPQTTVFGYEFLMDGNVVGMVEIINKGRVWINPALDEEASLVIAGLSTALLVRTNLQDQSLP